MNAERIEVSLGKSGGTMVFESIQELETWYNQERSFWSWLNNPPNTEPKNMGWQRYGPFLNNVQAQLTELAQIKRNALNAKQAPQFENNFKHIQNYFKSAFEQQHCLHSATPTAKFVADVRKESGDTIAAAALCYFLQCPLSLHTFEHFKGAMIGFAFETGICERKTHESQALEDLRIDWEKRFQSYRDTLETETNAHKKLNADGGRLISTQDIAHKELLAKQETALNELVATSKAEWNGLRKTYDEALAVRSPVTYWTRKVKSHLWLSYSYAAVAIITSGASLCVLIPEVKSMMEMPKGVQDPDKWHPEYWRFAVLIASALFCVWVVRILVRLLLSNIHLATDAAERVTMVQTYLALLRRDKIKDDERMFILQTLFRPTPTGIVKDDAVPLTIVEGITKLRG